ncbi:MAG TPA: tRNA epoxyqueuosine(34) reductase QueG, partial [Kiloniellales bacterium]|nr:tRNA epoxyqueuosine(34) reductase QueG [Kiloniellales bacterium]
HGTMAWLEEKADRRASPTALWPAAKTAVVVAQNYTPQEPPLANLDRPAVGNLSVYARNRDYHELIKGRLKHLAQFAASRLGAEVKVFVDTAPLMEKPLAQAAGLGWQGKHTNLLSRQLGNWFFLGVLLTDLDLPPDTAEEEHCGSCHACLDVCPTNAFPAPFQLDARRCISYLTIEHEGPIPAEFRLALGNRIFGCDDCLAVCPWNRFAAASREAKLAARADLVSPPLSELAALDDAAFRRRFAGSAVKRIGHVRFLRNVLIALGNSGEVGALAAVRPLLDHESAVVRGAAVWALRRLAAAAAFDEERSRRLPGEADATVRAEWAG